MERKHTTTSAGNLKDMESANYSVDTRGWEIDQILAMKRLAGIFVQDDS